MKYFRGYIITNSLTGKEYIGVTGQTIARRWSDHKSKQKSGHKFYLYNSMRKHGVNNFSIKEIIRINTQKEICAWEISTIKHRNTLAPNGYNMTLGGEGTSGVLYTKEQKKANSKRMKQFFIDNPLAKASNKARRKQYFIDNPDAGKEISKRQKQFYIDNPDVAKKRGATKMVPVLYRNKYFKSLKDAGIFFRITPALVWKHIERNKPGCIRLKRGSRECQLTC